MIILCFYFLACYRSMNKKQLSLLLCAMQYNQPLLVYELETITWIQ